MNRIEDVRFTYSINVSMLYTWQKVVRGNKIGEQRDPAVAHAGREPAAMQDDVLTMAIIAKDYVKG